MTLSFDREKEWKFETLTHRKSWADAKREKRNAQAYADWLWGVLKRTAPREKGEHETFTMMGVHMHPDNTLYLHGFIDPWTWLCYSPVDDWNVKVDEVYIEHWFEEKV